MTNQELIARHQAALTLNYGKLPAVMVRGEGSHLWDADGKKYIDLFAGFGGTILGHAYPAVADALQPAGLCALFAVGNQFLFRTTDSPRGITTGRQVGPDGRAKFFCHSGAEANEAAIKLTRIVPPTAKPPAASKSSPCNAPSTAAHQARLFRHSHARIPKRFPSPGPRLRHRPLSTIWPPSKPPSIPTPAPIMLEPIQGEGGIHVPADGYLRGSARPVRPPRSHAHLRRSQLDRLWPHRKNLRPPVGFRFPRHHDPGQSPRRRPPRRLHVRRPRKSRLPQARHPRLHAGWQPDLRGRWRGGDGDAGKRIAPRPRRIVGRSRAPTHPRLQMRRPHQGNPRPGPDARPRTRRRRRRTHRQQAPQARPDHQRHAKKCHSPRPGATIDEATLHAGLDLLDQALAV